MWGVPARRQKPPSAHPRALAPAVSSMPGELGHAVEAGPCPQAPWTLAGHCAPQHLAPALLLEGGWWFGHFALERYSEQSRPLRHRRLQARSHFSGVDVQRSRGWQRDCCSLIRGRPAGCGLPQFASSQRVCWPHLSCGAFVCISPRLRALSRVFTVCASCR